MSNARIEALIETVRTERTEIDDDDMEVFVYDERLGACDDLASAGAGEGLSAIEDLFIELLGRWGLKTLPQLKRISAALVALGGTEAFDEFVSTRVVRALASNAIEEAKRDLSPWAWHRQLRSWRSNDVLSALREEFGTIGDWETKVARKIAEEERWWQEEGQRRAEEVAGRAAAINRIRTTLEALESPAEEGEPLIDVDSLLPVLQDVLLHETGPELILAIRVAGKLRDPSLLQALEKVFLDPDHKVREVAGETLATFGAGAVTTLARHVRSDDWGVRTEAIKALMRIDDPEARRVLEDLRATEQNYEILKLLEEAPVAPEGHRESIVEGRDGAPRRKGFLFRRGLRSSKG